MLDLQRAFDVARAAAEAGAAVALAHWKRGVAVEWKADRTPVTIADRESEDAILAVIRAAFPEHGIVGEESGEVATGAARWIVDPIDGTRGFANGGTFWGPLVALEAEGHIVAGSLALPVQGEVYVAARGLGCWRGDQRIRLSTVARWEDAVLSLGEIARVSRRIGVERFHQLVGSAASTRSYGDVGAAAMLLQGRADCWIEAGVAPWDIAPQQILVEEAGGRFTDLTVGGKSGLLATNGLLHDHVLSVISPL